MLERMALRESNNKITFANQLRGIAVLCVMMAHYTGIYWGARDLVSSYIHAPVATGDGPQWPGYIMFPTLNYGPFGVALFFLISGFVIPFSLAKMGRLRFIVARALRIYPTYWLASAVTLLAMWLSSRYWGTPFSIDTHTLLANLELIHVQKALPTIDLVNWTLSIETKFYIVAALMWPFIRRSSALALVNFALLILAFLTWVPASWSTFSFLGMELSLDATKCELLYLPFLFIGTLFNFALKGDLSTRALFGAVLGVFASFLMMWQKTPLAVQFWVVPANYGYALIIFSACYVARARFKASRILDFFADISYPLYLVHALIGYATIRFLTDRGLPFNMAACFAFIVVVGIAYILHIVVEVRSANLGKRLGSRRLPFEPAATDDISSLK